MALPKKRVSCLVHQCLKVGARLRQAHPTSFVTWTSTSRKETCTSPAPPRTYLKSLKCLVASLSRRDPLESAQLLQGRTRIRSLNSTALGFVRLFCLVYESSRRSNRARAKFRLSHLRGSSEVICWQTSCTYPVSARQAMHTYTQSCQLNRVLATPLITPTTTPGTQRTNKEKA